MSTGKKDNGVPKLQIHKLVGKQTMPQSTTVVSLTSCLMKPELTKD